MRVSRMMLVTLRDVPADAEIVSHQLLLRAGYIKRVTSGIYAYLPLMLRVLQKINSIVREEINATGALETLLPQLQPAELWEKTGRWNSYTAGEGIMFHLKDRQGRKLGIGPTHEEIITTIAKETIHSYKQLPVILYQIQSKFRDEIRPRFGLMRSREFIMKDAYSFHSNEDDLGKTYTCMDIAYKKIFSRCGLKTVPVDADSGAIGGAASQEFMATAEAGEDLIMISSNRDYAANQEKAISIPKRPKPLPTGNTSIINTPNQSTIDELCSSNKFDPSQIIKVIIFIAKEENGGLQPLLISLRGDQKLNEVKIVNTLHNKLGINVIDLYPITIDEIRNQGLCEFPFGYLGPDLDDKYLLGAKTWKNKFLRIADHTATKLKLFICGSNKENHHVTHMSWDKLGGIPLSVDIRKAEVGDLCVHDQTQTLSSIRGIEVGHIFQLGRKYSDSLDAKYTNESGGQESFWMGCYGIGISRLAQAVIEQNHDENGIIWPISIAPYEIIISIANTKDKTQTKLGEELYNKLIKLGIEVLLDDRKERAGVKFKDADLLGIPWRIVVGREAEFNKIELFERSSRNTTLMIVDDAIKKLSSEIPSKRS